MAEQVPLPIAEPPCGGCGGAGAFEWEWSSSWGDEPCMLCRPAAWDRWLARNRKREQQRPEPRAWDVDTAELFARMHPVESIRAEARAWLEQLDAPTRGQLGLGF